MQRNTRDSIGKKLFAQIDMMNRAKRYRTCPRKVFKKVNLMSFAQDAAALPPRTRALAIRLIAHELTKEELEKLRGVME